MPEPTVLVSPPTRPGAGRLLAGLGLLAAACGLLACGGDTEARMAEVRALQDVGQFSASIEELREILGAHPELPEASYRLGVALVQTGEPGRAVWALEKAAESPEYVIPASMLLASAHFSQRNYEACVRAADRVLELEPDHHAALRMRAGGNLGAGQLAAALADNERLLEAYPDDYAVNAMHATLLADLDRLDEAEAANDRLKELALTGGDPVVAHRGCLAPAYFARDRRKDMERAEELFDDCVERYPTNGFVIGQAMRFYDKIDKPDKATELIERGVEEAPENLSLRSTLANRLNALGDSARAEQILREAALQFQSAAAWKLMADFYRTNDRYAAALSALDKMEELSEGDPDDQLRFARADVLIDLGRYAEADAIADDLDEQTYANLLRGRIALEQGDAQTALEYFEEGLRSWPNNAGARFLAGRAARQLGDLDRAIAELREAIRVDNSATSAGELLARIHYDRGEYAEAVRVARTAVARPGADPAGPYAIVSRSLAALERYDEARQVARTLGERGRPLQAAIELAAIERAAEGPAAVLRVVEESGLDLTDPANADLLRVQTEAALAQDDAEGALARIDAALEAHPEDADLLQLRGVVLTHLGRGDEALTALQKAVEIDPDHAAGWAGLATLAARSNRLPQAVELFDKAAALSPETSAYAYAAAQLSLAAGDKAGAERRLRNMVRRYPTHMGARNDLAWILADKGEELDWALELAEDAQRLDPSPQVLDTLGWVRLQRGEFPEAVEALELAVEARSDSPSIRYRLGLALTRSGDAERGREMLETAVESGTFPEADAARAELARLEQ